MHPQVGQERVVLDEAARMAHDLAHFEDAHEPRLLSARRRRTGPWQRASATRAVGGSRGLRLVQRMPHLVQLAALRRATEHLATILAEQHQVLDAHAAPAGKVDAWLDAE